jgi:WD40 repeat protein
MLAVGTTDSKIHILTRSYQPDSITGTFSSAASSSRTAAAAFKHSQVLSGHADWVRSLDFTAPLQLSESAVTDSEYGSQDVLLASGSQDTYTRTWRITSAPVKVEAATGLTALDSLDRLMESEIDAKRYIFLHE